MGKIYASLDDRLRQFIAQQPVFFVATAPTCTGASDGGHVNVSPKGYRDTFAVLGPTRVAYLDLTGSGAETIAHLRQNGRITIMFCSFGRTPKVLRLYGRGRAVLPCDARWPALAGHFPAAAGSGGDGKGSDGGGDGGGDGSGGNGNGGGNGNELRAIIVADLDRIADSCGYAVPVMDLREERDMLQQWAARKTPDQLADYRAERNAVSIDGLPALG